jgi:hypothetical protein
MRGKARRDKLWSAIGAAPGQREWGAPDIMDLGRPQANVNWGAPNSNAAFRIIN